MVENPMGCATLEVGVPIIFGLGVYWLSIFLIRGFRAKPEYEIDGGE